MTGMSCTFGSMCSALAGPTGYLDIDTGEFAAIQRSTESNSILAASGSPATAEPRQHPHQAFDGHISELATEQP